MLFVCQKRRGCWSWRHRINAASDAKQNSRICSSSRLDISHTLCRNTHNLFFPLADPVDVDRETTLLRQHLYEVFSHPQLCERDAACKLSAV